MVVLKTMSVLIRPTACGHFILYCVPLLRILKPPFCNTSGGQTEMKRKKQFYDLIFVRTVWLKLLSVKKCESYKRGRF